MIIYLHCHGFEFEVSMAFDYWDYIRLIWIAYLKNTNNSKCLLSSMPKDVIKHIISMIV